MYGFHDNKFIAADEIHPFGTHQHLHGIDQESVGNSGGRETLECQGTQHQQGKVAQ